MLRRCREYSVGPLGTVNGVSLIVGVDVANRHGKEKLVTRNAVDKGRGGGVGEGGICWLVSGLFCSLMLWTLYWLTFTQLCINVQWGWGFHEHYAL
jgi:hypothetical protein